MTAPTTTAAPSTVVPSLTASSDVEQQRAYLTSWANSERATPLDVISAAFDLAALPEVTTDTDVTEPVGLDGLRVADLLEPLREAAAARVAAVKRDRDLNQEARARKLLALAGERATAVRDLPEQLERRIAAFLARNQYRAAVTSKQTQALAALPGILTLEPNDGLLALEAMCGDVELRPIARAGLRRIAGESPPGPYKAVRTRALELLWTTPIDGDAVARERHARAVALAADTRARVRRDVLGFVSGTNL